MIASSMRFSHQSTNLLKTVAFKLAGMCRLHNLWSIYSIRTSQMDRIHNWSHFFQAVRSRDNSAGALKNTFYFLTTVWTDSISAIETYVLLLLAECFPPFWRQLPLFLSFCSLKRGSFGSSSPELLSFLAQNVGGKLGRLAQLYCLFFSGQEILREAQNPNRTKYVNKWSLDQKEF